MKSGKHMMLVAKLLKNISQQLFNYKTVYFIHKYKANKQCLRRKLVKLVRKPILLVNLSLGFNNLNNQ